MRKLKFLFSLLMLICFSVGTWAVDYELVYTLDGSVTTGGNSNYAQDGGGLTQDGISWSVTGNTTINPWRIGGKNLTDEDRLAYSKTAISDNVAKIEIEHGNITLSAVNSVKVEVASNADFSTILETFTTTTVEASKTITHLRPSGQDWSGAYYRITYNVSAGSSNSYIQLKSVKFYKEKAATPTVSVEKNGSAITELDFGEHEPASSYTSLTFDLKASNLTDGVYLESSDMAHFRIAADNYPNGLVYMTVNPTDGVIDTTITILASTLTSGTYDEELSITSKKSTPEFSDMSLGLKLKVLGPEIILKNNSTLDPMDDVDFGNVGKYQSRSAQFAFSYKRLQEGTLTITVSDDFTFSGNSQTETYEITSASGTTTYVSIYKNTQTVKNITDGWIKFTGCGLPSSGVLYDVKMNVKNPEVSIDITSTQDNHYDFGNIKQHTSCSSCSGSEYERKTIHIQGQYLANDIFTDETGAVFNIYPSRIYIDEDGSVDQDLDVDIYTGVAGTFAYDRYDGTKNWKMRIYSSAAISEFEEIYVYPKVTIVPTYSVQAYSSWETGLVSVNGSTPNSSGTAYVEDDTEEVTIKAIPNLGYAFSHWDADVWASNCTIADEYSATTTVTATAATQIRAWFTSVCTPLLRPYYPDVIDNTITYNSVGLKWNWVKYSDDSKVATYKVQVTDVEMDDVVATKSVSFTSAQLAEDHAEYTLTGLWGNTDYSVKIWATTTESGYCATGAESADVEFTTADYPAATLTLSENGVERTYEGTHKLNDMIHLPSEVVTGIVGKEFMGWSASSSCTTAPEYNKGQQYKLSAVSNKLYAVYATATPGTPTNHDLFATTSLGTTNTVTSGYTVSAVAGAKNGYYQDDGNVDAKRYVQVMVSNTETQIISTQPSAIKVTATIGGGSVKNPLGGSVYAVLLDADGNEMGASVELTDKVEATTGKAYTASLPINSYADVRGVRIYHVKESGYNVRYFAISMVYETGGEMSYSAYTTTGPRLLALPTFTPAEGTYTSAQNIAISAAEGTIYYNVDSNDDPTSASTVYSSAIALNTYGEHVIKAIAIDGDNKSNVATATYFMNLPFASLQDLVDANLPATGTEDVTVSFSSIAIDSIKNSSKSVYLHVLADGKGIYIYNGAAACPTTWEVDGRLSGTITGKWIKFNDKEWEIVPNSGFAWTDLTYTKASVSATPNTLNLGSIKQNFGELSKTFTLSGEGVTKSVKLTTNSIRLSVSPSVVSATDVLAGKEITVTGTSSWSGDQEYTVSVATEEAPYEVVATNLVTVSWSVTPTNIVYVTTNNTAYGTVKINSSTSGQWAVTATEEFTLDATALSGYVFDKWTTDDDSKVTIADINDASTTAVATGSVTITANFKKAPEGVLTLSKNVVDFGASKVGSSVASQSFKLSGTGFTPNGTISLAFAGDNKDYFGLVTDSYTADANGAISEKNVEILVDETAYATYGVRDCQLKISSDDLASDSIVTIKLHVGAVITITPAEPDLAFGEVLKGDDESKYKKTIHLNVTNMDPNCQVRIDPYAGFRVDGNYYRFPNAQGVIDVDLTFTPNTSSSVGVISGPLQFFSAGSPSQFSSPMTVATMSMTMIASTAITVPDITGGSLSLDGGAAPIVAKPGSTHTLLAVPASGYTGGSIAVLKAEDDTDVTDDVMSGSTLTVPSYAIKIVVSGFEATAHPSGLGWRYGGADVTTHAHTFGASTERFYFPQLKNPNEIDLDDIEFVSSDSTVAEFGARTHEYSSWFAAVWVKKAGTAVMTARLKNHATYDDIEVSYTLTVSKGELAANQFRWVQYPDIYEPESDTYTWYESHNWPYINASSTYVDKANEVTYESSNTDVATISSTGSITPVANGPTVIKAKFIGNDMFNAKTVQFTLNVQKASPVLSWSSTPTTSNTTVDLADSYGIYTFPRFGSVSPYVDALKDLVVLSSSDPTVAEINSNGYVNPLAEGQTTIKLSLAATDKSNAAEELSYTFTVTDSRPVLTIVAGDHGTYEVRDNSNTYTIENGAKVKANTNLYLRSLSAETGYKNTPVYKVVKTSDNTDITSTALNGSYLRMQSYDMTISATYPEKAVAPIGWSSTETQYAYTDDRPYTLPTLVNAGLPVSFASSNTNVATISYDGSVSVWSAGTTNISVSYAGDGNYKQTTVSYELVVRSPHHLEVTGDLNKKSYDYDEAINCAGMTATLYYTEDNSDGVDVTSAATWSSSPAKVTTGYVNAKITATYKGKEGYKNVGIFMKQYTVTFSSALHGTFVVKNNGTAISTGDQFPKGTVLTVEATPDAGYALATLTANGEDIMSSKQITIGTTEVTIAATFKQGPSLVSNTYSIDFGEVIKGSASWPSQELTITGANLTAAVDATALATGGGAVFYIEDKSYVRLTPVEGSINATVSISANPNLPVGEYNGSVKIESIAATADFEPIYVDLHMTIVSNATALDNVETEEPASKILLNNQLFIIRDGKMFDASGALVK